MLRATATLPAHGNGSSLAPANGDVKGAVGLGPSDTLTESPNHDSPPT
jgi:hypothetical protein